MKIHEYQGKIILNKFNVPIQDGYIIQDIEKAEETIKMVQNDFNTKDVIVKAQIHAGGRGKGGGVKYSPDFESALQNVKNILGMKLVTHQTGPKGKIVNTVYITKSFDIKKEYYAAITLDRSKKRDVFMASTEGGMDIETVAKETPEKIIKVWIDPGDELTDSNAQLIGQGLKFEGKILEESISIFKNMYRCYKEMDCSILEINPLILTDQNDIVAVDAKFNFDNNALFRHPEILEMKDETEEDPMELQASKYNLNYIKLDGNVGCMVNGAGLAMATMDIIKLSGGNPANFLDIGGAANAETVLLPSDDFVGISFWVISMGMLAATAFFFMERGNVAAGWRTSITVAGLITGIAFVNYVYMRGVWIETNDTPTVFRYIDWLITVPLQIVEFYLILTAVRKVPSGIFWRLLIGSLVMVIGGFLGEAKHIPPVLGFLISMAGWIYVLYEIFSGEAGKAVSKSGNKPFVTAFSSLRMIVTIGWAIYPLGYIFGYLNNGLDEASLNVIYNLADFVNKIAFGLVIWTAAISSTGGARR